MIRLYIGCAQDGFAIISSGAADVIMPGECRYWHKFIEGLNKSVYSGLKRCFRFSSDWGAYFT